jgi:1,4-dihydroxy-2-naphthoate octaprenyltransferase
MTHGWLLNRPNGFVPVKRILAHPSDPDILVEEQAKLTTRAKLKAWLALSRLPFHSVGVLPFVLGTVLAWRQRGALRWDVLVWGVLGVVLIMLATYYAGEYWDYTEDALSGRAASSRFAGGSQVLQRGLLPRRAALWASLASLALAGGVGLVLQFGYHTGPYTLAFGLLGMLGGFFYSTRPVRWVGRGWGELWIGFCYGWLPVAVGYYLQVSEIAPIIHWLALPIGLTIFNVILLNEFPDYAADREAGKANLTVRLGRERAAWLYAVTSLLSWLAMWLALQHGVPAPAAWLHLPVLLLSMIVVVLVLAGRWRNRDTLDKLCAANLLVNLGTTAVYILVFMMVSQSV